MKNNANSLMVPVTEAKNQLIYIQIFSECYLANIQILGTIELKLYTILI